MELGTLDDIRKAVDSRGAIHPKEKPRQRMEHRRCGCGRCATCLDNARWERIFLEKFADPTYYQPRPIRQTSPLS